MNLERFASSVRNKVSLMEAEIKKHPDKILKLEIKDYFSDGVYARELFIPKDTIVVGKIHKYQNLNILVAGDISVLIGDEIRRLRPPNVVVSPPGIKRIAYAHEDTIWTTILRTDEINSQKIEDHFTANSEEEFVAFCQEQEQFKLFDTKVLT